MRKGVAMMGVLMLLAACGRGDDRGANNAGASLDAPIVTISGDNATALPLNVANSGEPAKGGADDDAAVRAVVDAIYAAYKTPGGGGGANAPLSPDFKAAWNRAVGGAQAGLGYDAFCDCQDFDPAAFAYQVQGVEFAPDGDHVHVRLSLRLTGHDAPVPKTMLLLRTPRGWLVDDLGNRDTASLKALMKASKPGELGEGGGQDAGAAAPAQ